ncbi:hypothetical protein DL95DRAFT_114906 [Leptodontidium sp. 2 PMI_412]|nr:hypothetical protein DL95DRAFT_114906 [Leptodontidium sp. 2 PMI_412]
MGTRKSKFEVQNSLRAHVGWEWRCAGTRTLKLLAVNGMAGPCANPECGNGSEGVKRAKGRVEGLKGESKEVNERMGVSRSTVSKSRSSSSTNDAGTSDSWSVCFDLPCLSLPLSNRTNGITGHHSHHDQYVAMVHGCFPSLELPNSSNPHNHQPSS